MNSQHNPVIDGNTYSYHEWHRQVQHRSPEALFLRRNIRHDVMLRVLVKQEEGTKGCYGLFEDIERANADRRINQE